MPCAGGVPAIRELAARVPMDGQGPSRHVPCCARTGHAMALSAGTLVAGCELTGTQPTTWSISSRTMRSSTGGRLRKARGPLGKQGASRGGLPLEWQDAGLALLRVKQRQWRPSSGNADYIRHVVIRRVLAGLVAGSLLAAGMPRKCKKPPGCNGGLLRAGHRATDSAACPRPGPAVINSAKR